MITIKPVLLRSNLPSSVCIRQNTTPSPETLKRIQEFRDQGDQCDLALRLDEKRILAHRSIVNKSIPYFKAMLQYHDLANETESETQEIALPYVDAFALQSIIEYVYTGELEVNEDNAIALILCADFLQHNKVREICDEFLILRLNPENVLGIYQSLELLTEIGVEASLLLHSNFVEVAQCSEFLDLGVSELVRILSSDNLNVAEEEEVFSAVMRWIRHDQEARAESLPALLETVRCTILSPEFKENQLENNELLKNSTEARAILGNVNQPLHSPRKHKFVGKIYILKQSRTPSYRTETIVYYPRLKQFSRAKPMPRARNLFNGCAYDGKLYTFGGCNGVKDFGVVEVYDPRSDSWSILAPMTVKRCFTGVAAFEDRIYVCGGSIQGVDINTVECYWPKTNTWTTAAPMLERHSSFQMVRLGDFLYAVGGYGVHVEKYDPIENVWTMEPPMLIGRHGAGVTTCDRKIYVAGGLDIHQRDALEVYDPERKTWSMLAPMLRKRVRFSLVTNMGKLFALGGEPNNSIEVYDPVSDQWTMNGYMPMDDSNFLAVAIHEFKDVF